MFGSCSLRPDPVSCPSAHAHRILGLRFRGKHLIEWTSLGLDIDLLKGGELPLRVRFRRADAFASWRAVNPRATTSAAGSPVRSRA